MSVREGKREIEEREEESERKATRGREGESERERERESGRERDCLLKNMTLATMTFVNSRWGE